MFSLTSEHTVTLVGTIGIQFVVASGITKLAGANAAPASGVTTTSSGHSNVMSGSSTKTIGGVKGSTVTKSSQLAEFPKSSVTVIVTIWTPTSASVKLVGVTLTETICAPQLPFERPCSISAAVKLTRPSSGNCKKPSALQAGTGAGRSSILVKVSPNSRLVSLIVPFIS